MSPRPANPGRSDSGGPSPDSASAVNPERVRRWTIFVGKSRGQWGRNLRRIGEPALDTDGDWLEVVPLSDYERVVEALREFDDEVAAAHPSQTGHWGGGDVPEPPLTDAEALAVYEQAHERLFQKTRALPPEEQDD